MSFFYTNKPKRKDKVFKDRAKRIDYGRKQEVHSTSGEKLVNATDKLKKSSKTAELRIWMIVIPILISVILAVTSFLLYRDYSAGRIDLGFLKSSSKSVSSQIESDSDTDTQTDNLEERLVAVVNNKKPIDEQYEPELVAYNDLFISKDMAEDLEKMVSDALSQNVELNIIDAYVTAQQQQQRYEDTLKYYMDMGYSSVKAQASTMRTVPDGISSEHRTGLNITLSDEEHDDFSKSPAYSWLYRNSADYGFVLRYPEGSMAYTGMQPSYTEFRYVGVTNAKRMRTLDMCLEEYVIYLSKQG